MKTFILENIYMSDMSAPSVCSTNRFPTFESAIPAMTLLTMSSYPLSC